MPALIERTEGYVVADDGSLIQRPTMLIGADAASIMRRYFRWALTQQLKPELFCASCFDHTREAKAIYNISDDQIQIVCQCQIRVFQGASLPADPIAANTTLPIDGEVAQVTLSDDAARLLRLYKKVLIDIGLKEALRCNACWDLNLEDGCAAQVTSNSIYIRCRCTSRTFLGMTI